jgi:hypothetical protein
MTLHPTEIIITIPFFTQIRMGSLCNLRGGAMQNNVTKSQRIA